MASSKGFLRDSFEKVCRLTDILRFITNNDKLNESFALKGGTAINMTIFDVPRLSVDSVRLLLLTDRKDSRQIHLIRLKYSQAKLWRS
jgi:hypothetical protein